MKIFSKITASNYILPTEVLTNEDLLDRFEEKKLKSISKLSGISKRRIAPEGITAMDLGAEAAKRMIETCGIDKREFDMVIFVTQTGDYILPGSSFLVHERLELPQTCAAFDINAGCAAFPYALTVANGLVASGQFKKVLLILSDTVTKLVHPKDRGLVTLHGDGAACFVVEKTEDGDDCGFEFAEMGSDSSNWRHLMVPDGGMRKPLSESSKIEKTDETGISTSDECLQMNGAAVFHFGISKVPEAIAGLLEKKNRSIDDYNLVLLHQANKMMITQIYNALKVPEEKRFFFMEEIGNLSVASSAVLLAEALRVGKLENGGRVLLSAFGVGLTWATFSIKFAPHSCKAATGSIDF